MRSASCDPAHAARNTAVVTKPIHWERGEERRERRGERGEERRERRERRGEERRGE